MSLLKPIEAGSGYLKANLYGEAGSGKTTLAVKLAIGTRKLFGLTGPIVFFDTENGSPWVSEWVGKETGVPMLGIKSRSFDDLKAVVGESISIGAAALIVDSVSHPWDELQQTYLKSINEERRRSRLNSLDRLEFQHLNALKIMWGAWTNLFLNSPLHIVTCGRLQNKWKMEENERGKRELVNVGTKMRAEKEFGYEASILVEMSCEAVMDGNRVTRNIHRAFVEKDRNQDPATKMDGKTFDDPSFDTFLPHVSTLAPAKHVPIAMERESVVVVDEQGSLEWQRERRQREIAMEEIAAELDKCGLGGTSADAKTKRPALLELCFGTASKTKLEGTNSDALRGGLAKLREEIAKMKPIKEA